jgi:hypothetical protein
MPASPAKRTDQDAASRAMMAGFYNALGGQLADGIYIGLDNDRYHADSALGSTNIRDILKGANNYWAKSAMNPRRKKRKPTDALIVGSAIHKLLLEGREAFDAHYVRGPYDGDFEGSSSEKAALTKTAKKELLEGQDLIVADVYDYVLGIKEIIDADPELEGCLDGGLSEVSVFWTRPDGVRCKARLDALKINGIGDLKSIANERDRDLEEACLLDIKTYRYDIPVAHYSEGRRQMAALLNKSSVYFGDGTVLAENPAKRSAEERRLADYLYKCAASEAFGFQLVFIPKPNKTGTTAPDAWACTITPGNEIELMARTDIETAIERFKRALEEFGPGKRWTPNREVREIVLGRPPLWLWPARREGALMFVALVPRNARLNKPAHGTPCNRCGLCCQATLCPLARHVFKNPEGQGPCPALSFGPEGSECGLVSNPALHAPVVAMTAGVKAASDAALFLIGSGLGCDARLAGEPGDPEFYAMMERRQRAEASRARAAKSLWGGC